MPGHLFGTYRIVQLAQQTQLAAPIFHSPHASAFLLTIWAFHLTSPVQSPSIPSSLDLHHESMKRGNLRLKVLEALTVQGFRNCIQTIIAIISLSLAVSNKLSWYLYLMVLFHVKQGIQVLLTTFTNQTHLWI